MLSLREKVLQDIRHGLEQVHSIQDGDIMIMVQQIVMVQAGQERITYQ